MVMKAWKCACGGDLVMVGREGPFLHERVAGLEELHSGPGHHLVAAAVDDVAPVPVL